MDRDKLDTGKSDRLKISFRGGGREREREREREGERGRERERRFDRSKSDRDKLDNFDGESLIEASLKDISLIQHS